MYKIPVPRWGARWAELEVHWIRTCVLFAWTGLNWPRPVRSKDVSTPIGKYLWVNLGYRFGIKDSEPHAVSVFS